MNCKLCGEPIVTYMVDGKDRQAYIVHTEVYSNTYGYMKTGEIEKSGTIRVIVCPIEPTPAARAHAKTIALLPWQDGKTPIHLWVKEAA